MAKSNRAALANAVAKPPAPEPTAPAAPARQYKYPKPPSREGKIAFTFYGTPAYKKRFLMLQLQSDDTDLSFQTIMLDALDDYFAKKGLPAVERER